jgi:hypothetical protein
MTLSASSGDKPAQASPLALKTVFKVSKAAEINTSRQMLKSHAKLAW